MPHGEASSDEYPRRRIMETFELAMKILTVGIGIAGLVWFGVMLHTVLIMKPWIPGNVAIWYYEQDRRP